MVVLHEMLQGLLAERFHLEFHREMRELPVYSLVMGKNGHKMGPPASKGLRVGADFLGGSSSMPNFAVFLAGQLGRPVTDKTGLDGEFEFKLEYDPDLGALPEAGAAKNRPTIFTAIQEQMGLKLEPGKAPVEVMVIDKVEKPSEN
jgi:uncharacterized protein (TIGR03435 family)